APRAAPTTPPISRRCARGTTCAVYTRACSAAPASRQTGCASSWACGRTVRRSWSTDRETRNAKGRREANSTQPYRAVLHPARGGADALVPGICRDGARGGGAHAQGALEGVARDVPPDGRRGRGVDQGAPGVPAQPAVR